MPSKWSAKEHAALKQALADSYSVDELLGRVQQIRPSVKCREGLVAAVQRYCGVPRLSEHFAEKCAERGVAHNMKVPEIDIPVAVDLSELPPEEQTRFELKIRELQRSNEALLAAKEKLLSQLGDRDAQIAALTQLGSAPPMPIVAPRGRGEGKRRLATPVILLSDWHVEEPVHPETVNGLNEYNLDIAERCIERCAEAFVWLTRDPRFDMREALVWLGGDLFSGYIHAELQESNFLSPVQACVWLQERIEKMLRRILAETQFERIVVPCNDGNHGRCHDASTEILTRVGWKTYRDIQIGDHVATYDMKTRTCVWQALTDVYVAHYDGEMISVKTRTADFMVTPRHRMVLAHPSIREDAFIEICELVSRGTFGGKQFPKCALGHDRDISGITDDELRLLGWIFTDGTYHERNIHISQSKDSTQLRDLLDRLGLEYTSSTRHRPPPVICGVQCKTSMPEKTFRISVDSSIRFFCLVPDKHIIPEWAKDLSVRQFNVLLGAMLLGDGSCRCRQGHGIERVLYKPKAFLDQVQALAVTNGIPARVRKDNRGDYVLSLPRSTRGNIIKFKNAVSTVPYSGVIWCGTVPNGTLITRRNGIPLVSGNTTQKMRVSTRTENSLEWLLYKTIAQRFANEPRIQFQIADGEFNFVDVFDHTIGFFHGDSVRYQGGVGGLMIPMRKALNELRKYRKIDSFAFGHFHQYLPLPEMTANGSLIGLGPYSMSIKASPEPRQQAFFLIDSEKGKCMSAPVWLT